MSERTETRHSSPSTRGSGRGGRGMSGQKPKSVSKALKKLLQYLRVYRVALILVIVFAAVAAGLSIAGPYIIAKIMNHIQNNVYAGLPLDMTYIFNTMFILIGIFALSYAFNLTQGLLIARTTQKLTKQMRSDLFKKMERIPLSYFDRTSHGDTLSRMTNDIDLVGQAMNNSVSQLTTSFTTIIGVTVMMFVIHWVIALIALAVIPLSTFILRFIMKRSQKYFRQQQKYLGELNGHIEESYSGQQILKVYQAEKPFIEKFDEHNQQLLSTAWKSQFFSGLMFPLMNFVGNIGYVIIAIVGAGYGVNGVIGIGDISALLTYNRRLNQPLGTIAQSLTQVQSALAASERVFEFLEIEEMSKEEATTTVQTFKGAVQFKDVHFGYEPDKEIIHGFSLDVKPGQKIAIVGPTGAGKTTLVNLLMRFYEVNRGDILIDGVSIKQMKREDVHRYFGMVLQDTWLFEGTIRENLSYGKEHAVDDEVIAAAKTANVHHFIKSLPHGYDMILSENSSISQGQRQLMTIARAMVTNAPMLILDEATSSVDVRTEILIQDAMDELMKGRTTFVIAHRLSTIKNADVILVLNNGSVVERGKHEELLAQKGFYADLYNSQFEM